MNFDKDGCILEPIAPTPSPRRRPLCRGGCEVPVDARDRSWTEVPEGFVCHLCLKANGRGVK